MAYELKWGNRTWIYAFALGLGLGLPILLLFKEMLGDFAFWTYYSPMLGYYVLISICQSHYFRRKPEPDMGGMFRQFVSIFGAILIFFVNGAIIEYVFEVPDALIMGGHFTFIVFGFFIYGFDDFMFKGKLLGWMGNDTAKAFFWYFFIWALWGFLFFSDNGIAKAHSTDTFGDGEALNRMLAISQFTIIISLLYALLFKDWLPDLQERSGIKNDFIYGLILLVAAIAIGAVIAFLLFFIAPSISPAGDHATDSEIWHHVLYMGTYPLIPAILIGVYTKNFNHLETSGQRVIRRIAVLVPAVVILYFAYHFIIARPEQVINYFSEGAVEPGFGLFGEADKSWYHQLGLYFNFTVSIIPLTHHWFCGKAGFVEEVQDDDLPEEKRMYASRREPPMEDYDKPIGRGDGRPYPVRRSRSSIGARRERDSREWR